MIAMIEMINIKYIYLYNLKDHKKQYYYKKMIFIIIYSEITQLYSNTPHNHILQ